MVLSGIKGEIIGCSVQKATELSLIDFLPGFLRLLISGTAFFPLIPLVTLYFKKSVLYLKKSVLVAPLMFSKPEIVFPNAKRAITPIIFT